jgi:predicted phosphodiesterase
MRSGVLADIHGNLRALTAVQADLRKYSPDVVVNLGDHLSGPLQAAATALMSEKYVHIRGNHDRQLLDRPIAEMGASDRAAYTQLESRHKVWLQSLPPTLEIEGDILLCHGSPGDDLQYLMRRLWSRGLSWQARKKSRTGCSPWSMTGARPPQTHEKEIARIGLMRLKPATR